MTDGTGTVLTCAEDAAHYMGVHDPRCYPNSGWFEAGADPAVEAARVPRIAPVEPIRGTSENALRQLLVLVDMAEKGQIRALACAWEETDGVSNNFTREPGGSLLLLMGSLSLLKSDVKAEIRKEREDQ